MTSSTCEEVPADCRWSVRQSSVLSSNRHLFDRQLACDVHFVVQGYGDRHAVTVGAHRYVLYSRSPVFYRMFCQPPDDDLTRHQQDSHEPDDKEIRIDDMPIEAFKQLLRHACFIVTLFRLHNS